MKPEEIRIGNKVYYNGTHKEEGSVTGIRIYFDRSCLVNLNGRANGQYKIEELKPIPITEDILLKCGFEKDYSNNCPGKCYKIKIDTEEISYCLKYYKIESNCIYLCHKQIKIDYLHQLQNFIFEYTGKELNINVNG